MEEENFRLQPDWIKEVQAKHVLHWNYRGFVEVPRELQHAGDQLEEIYMKWNYISQLPSWFTAIDHLTNLYLFGNEISYLPEELGSMTSLSVLDFGHNQLTNLPASIVKLTRLRCLSVEFNSLTQLPSDIGKLKKLEHLKVNGNKLKYLPNSISLCENLSELIADLNHLKFLPQNIVYLPKLNFLSVKSNQLRFMPAVAFFKSPIEVLVEDNEYLNYLSFDMSSFIANSRIQMGRDEVFDFCNRKEKSSSPSDQNLHLISNSIHLKNSNEEVVLPPTLNKLHGHANKGCIISLQEYCLRIVYSMIYRLNRLNSSCLQNQISNILPVNITNLFLDGPTALCHRCKKPIFREAIMILFSRAIPLMNLNLIKKMKLTVFFCERSCYYESDFLEKDSILQREIEWVS
ncbi:unnamed protein product [Bemisia tabaci]|uniref:Leucine-rich repeat-containing protein 28 n=1 Tax=Bemisia tabaci TaxID=7038 RepID=A0A9N9ZZF2_BEMTA|nr:unnamed protein product [Bemisia tabaci]